MSPPMQSLAVSVLAAVVAGCAALAAGGERTFVLEDHLGVAWQDELVSFTFEFPEGECHQGSLRLAGPSGPVPVQVVRSASWPDESGLLKSATVVFFADLAPLAKDRYVLSWAADPNGAPPAPLSQLKVGKHGDLVAVASHAFGAVFRTGAQEFAVPVSADRVPGPVHQMLLPDGRRFGGSRMYGPSKLTAWSGEVAADGPVFAEIRWRYGYEDGTEFILRGRLGARDTAIYWDMACRGTLRNDGWQLLISNGLPPLSLSVQIEHFSKRTFPDRTLAVGDLVSFPLAAEPAGRLTSVTPWSDWTNDYTQTVAVLTNPDGTAAFFAASRDPGAWVEPRSAGDARNQKSIPLVKREDGSVGLSASVMDAPGGGLRRWMTGVLPPGAWEAVQEISRNRFTDVVQRQLQPMLDKRRLDWVKDFVLDWPQAAAIRRPMLVVSQEEVRRSRSRRTFPQQLADRFTRVRGAAVSEMPDSNDGIALAVWLLRGSQQAATETRILERLRQRLGLLGNFDLMRSAPLVATLYDGVIDSGLVGEAERRLMRARMAFLGYRLEDPATWSVERGFNTSLPNMNVSYTLGRGMVACTLPDHPRAGIWVAPALERMDRWLNEDVGTRGEWMEGASYDHVTASSMLAFVIAAKNAGFRDYSRNEKFRLLIEYIAKQYTPPDPTRGDIRVTPPLGRANAGVRMGVFGAMSRFVRDTDPARAAEMQWMWRQSGSRYPIGDNRLCGLEYLYIDPDAPSRRPDWSSEWFPLATAVLRNRFGDSQEDYVNLLLNPEIHFARPSEVGAVLKWFAFGKPVAGAFTGGYVERHELLMSRVVPARSPSPDQWRQINFHKIRGGVIDFSSQPSLDYLDAQYTIEAPATADWPMPAGMPAWPAVDRQGQPPLPWRRQVAFVKGPGTEPAYLVFRDSIAADQPTLWQFWSLSNGIVEAGQPARPRGAADARSPAQPLRGNAFTAAGQHGVDLDYFVITPDNPAAHTLRWGTRFKNPPDPGYTEHQDLLQLRLAGAGSYTVVIIPRRAGESLLTVTGEAGGRVIRVTHHGGSDLLVFGDPAEPITLDGKAFDAAATLVQRRGTRQANTVTPPPQIPDAAGRHSRGPDSGP